MPGQCPFSQWKKEKGPGAVLRRPEEMIPFVRQKPNRKPTCGIRAAEFDGHLTPNQTSRPDDTPGWAKR